jgi:acetyl esterase/lipase
MLNPAPMSCFVTTLCWPRRSGLHNLGHQSGKCDDETYSAPHHGRGRGLGHVGGFGARRCPIPDGRDADAPPDKKCAQGSARTPAPAHQTIAYGPDPMQNMDFTPPAKPNGAAPLVVFVHGGAWTQGNKDNATGGWKAPHYTSLGYAFASINYRLVPQVRVEDEAGDVAAALARLIAEADKLGIDRRRSS